MTLLDSYPNFRRSLGSLRCVYLSDALVVLRLTFLNLGLIVALIMNTKAGEMIVCSCSSDHLQIFKIFSSVKQQTFPVHCEMAVVG